MTDRIQADTVYRNAYVVTLDADRRVFTDGFVAVRGADIVAVGRDADCAVDAGRTVNATGKVLMPGMVNAHNHINQIAFRARMDDTPGPPGMLTLATQQIGLWRNAGRKRTAAAVRLHLLEMLKGGTTASHDQHFTNIPADNIEGALEAFDDSGMRAFVSRCLLSEPNTVPADAVESVSTVLKETERLRAAWNSDRIQVTASPINPTWVRTGEELQELRAGLRAMGAPFDIDLAGDEWRETMERRGWHGSVTEYCDSLGILDDQTLGGKSFLLQPQDYAIWAARGVKACVVPHGRLYRELGNPMHRFLAAGIVPGIGTDAPLSHPTASMWEAMRLMLLGASTRRLAESRAGELPATAPMPTVETALEMATIAGARAIFLDPRVRGVEAGAAADFILVDTDNPAIQPTLGQRRLPTILVHCGEASMVDTVVVNGRTLVEGGRSTVWDEEKIIAEGTATIDALYEESGIAASLPARRPGDTFRGWQYL